MGSIISLADTESLLVEHLCFMLNRYGRKPDYPFIDTKVSIATGDNFGIPANGGTVLDHGVIYGWVQGRAMESLAGHIEWLEGETSLIRAEALRLAGRARQVLRRLVPALEEVRARNGGRMTFMFRADGQPLCVDPDGRPVARDAIVGDANFSDLFCAKGLFAAGLVLDDAAVRSAGEEYFRQVSDAIMELRFRSDQEPLNPRNPAAQVPGRIPHGPAMISLGGIALMLRTPRALEWAGRGTAAVSRILDRHVNHGQHTALQPLDFTEFVDAKGKPWTNDGTVLCDPGHGLEFVGLSCKLLLSAERAGVVTEDLKRIGERCRATLPHLLLHLFECGFDRDQGGIRKTIDLLSREPVNNELPWWSLPETIRAAVLLLQLWSDVEPDRVAGVLRDCHGALITHYCNPDVNHLFYQSRDGNGRVIDVLPAFPDVDPCYHAGLTLLDVIQALRERRTALGSA